VRSAGNIRRGKDPAGAAAGPSAAPSGCRRPGSP